ncbi:hypothetical protein [Eudoraea chungangensis]|uniref:hypothetical protein n=1 Tax=Eudoraea chungangensis TaxID=1481905 RepID=UPI0023EB590B|nr:hypothetical protein [Eudoraea chungangensis]
MLNSFIKKLNFTLIVLLMALGNSQQLMEDYDLFLVREDKVTPSMSTDYEMSLADLKAFLAENDIKDFNYFTHFQDDYKFLHIVPIDNLNDLRKGTREAFKSRINKPELELIMDYFDLSVDSYKQYIVRYQPDLSYVKEDDNWNENASYRKWNFYYFYPGNEKEVEALLAAYKELYKQKDITMGFRVFSGLLGTEKPLYILTTWGESPLDYHENLELTSSALGDRGAELWTSMMKLVRDTRTTEGWYLPQYSYAPGLKFAE